MADLRTGRTLGVTAQPSEAELQMLAELSRHPGYATLLNVMERAVVTMESRLISTPVDATKKVIAEHRKVQAAWQIFEYLQETVKGAADDWQNRQQYIASDPFTAQERADDNLLNPLHSMEELEQ
jgi:hypothetical protein